jgi:hypothetical protein
MTKEEFDTFINELLVEYLLIRTPQMPTGNRNYYIDEMNDGFICHCFVNFVQVDRRFFTDRKKAEEFGEDWVGPNVSWALDS